tara:strand:+ start:564 stop:797 length:234 start_codon:yes stop_codon:yes gene_type:complete
MKRANANPGANRVDFGNVIIAPKAKIVWPKRYSRYLIGADQTGVAILPDKQVIFQIVDCAGSWMTLKVCILCKKPER